MTIMYTQSGRPESSKMVFMKKIKVVDMKTALIHSGHVPAMG
jgi:hypothetical protein